MAKKANAVIVDTYAIMADLTGQASPEAIRVLDSIRRGETEGIIHYLIVYELTYHWRKGRLPFRNEEELLDFVSTYFNIVNLTPEIAVVAARIKIEGDKALRSSGETRLRRRKLSTSDATTIALAQKLKKHIITGDKGLTYVAEKIGVRTIW